MDEVSARIGIDGISLEKVLNFLPYPVLLSEFRQQQQMNIFANKRFVDQFGYTISEIPTIVEWFALAYPDPEYRAKISAHWLSGTQLAHQSPSGEVSVQAKIQTKRNGSKWYEVKASVLGNVHFVAFVNIDDEIQREVELQMLNENKNRTLSILSHDLRAPLTSLQSVLELVTSDALDEVERRELLLRLRDQVFQLTEFLDTTLHWTKSNFNEIVPVRTDVMLSEVCDKVLALYQRLSFEKRLSIKVEIEHDSVHADPEIVAVLIRNLVSNAVKYTPVDGNITIRTERKADRVIISIENSGIAIDEKQIERILARDYSSKVGTSGEKGLGLGLTLCQQLLEKIGGTLEIERPSKNSTVFKLIFKGKENSMP